MVPLWHLPISRTAQINSKHWKGRGGDCQSSSRTVEADDCDENRSYNGISAGKSASPAPCSISLLAARYREPIYPGFVGAHANAEAPQRHVLCVCCSMSASTLVSNEQRSVGQFHRLTVAVAVIHKKAVVLHPRNPCVPSISAEIQPQGA